AYGFAQDTYNLGEDGGVSYTATYDAYKEALKTLAQWYSEGLIDPESFTDDRAKLREKWSSGMIGIMNDNHWWGESARGANSVFNMLYSRDPDAKVTAFPAVTGPEGLSGAQRGFPGITGQAAVLFGADTSDEKVIRIMQIKESFTDIEEYKRGRYGIEGETYDIDGNGVLIMRPEWNFEMQRSKGIGQFYALQPQSIEDVSLVLQPQDIATNEIALKSNPILVGANFYAPRTNRAQADFSADVSTIVKEYRANAIMGRVNIDETWDAYVDSLMNAGLTEILAEYEEMLR
ncbi:MAG TPA: hypothetical protein PKE04_10995, partial [Clostridia bacterium]|nr:hypothetical protein [Clostridia bacterium]